MTLFDIERARSSMTDAQWETLAFVARQPCCMTADIAGDLWDHLHALESLRLIRDSGHGYAVTGNGAAVLGLV